MYDAWEIAKHLVRLGYSPECPEESVYVCPLRLQKLLYYCQGWHLGLFGEPLFHQPVEAWAKGPVVRDVYARLAGQRDPIRPDAVGGAAEPLPETVAGLLRMVWREYAGYTPAELIRKTHSEPAWREARGDFPVDAPSSAPLSHDTMLTFFRETARKAVPVSAFPMPDPVDVWQADREFERSGGRGIPLGEAIRQAKASRPA